MSLDLKQMKTLNNLILEGTTYSGYAYSFTADPDDINIMRKWEGDDPGKKNL